MAHFNLDVLIAGAYGSGNLGDDVLLGIVFDLVRDQIEVADVGILGTDSGYLDRLAKGATLVPRNQSYDVRTHVCIYGGGTQFFLFKGQQTLISRLAIAFRNPRYAIRRLMGVYRQCISANYKAMIGIGFGPFETDSPYISTVNNTIAGCELIAVRDEASYLFCQRHGHELAYLAADIAFCSSFQDKLFHASNSSETATPDPPPEKLRIAFILRDWTHGGGHHSHIRNSLTAATQMQKLGHEIEFVIFGRDPGLDRTLLAAIGNVVQWDPDTSTEEAFIAQLHRYDLIASARFHGAVFAFLLGIPTIGICIDPKISLFMDRIGQPDMKWEMPYDPSEILTKARARLFAREDPHHGKSDQVLKQLTKQADKMCSDLSGFLVKHFGSRS